MTHLDWLVLDATADDFESIVQIADNVRCDLAQTSRAELARHIIERLRDGFLQQLEPGAISLEDLVLERLGPAAADAHDPLGVLGLEPLRLAEVAEQPVVGRLTDRAGVEQDHVGVVARVDAGVAERVQHAGHALGVVLVHLTPEGGQVIGPAHDRRG